MAAVLGAARTADLNLPHPSDPGPELFQQLIELVSDKNLESITNLASKKRDLSSAILSYELPQHLADETIHTGMVLTFVGKSV